MLKKKAGESERSFPGVFCEDSRDQERVAAMMGSRESKRDERRGQMERRKEERRNRLVSEMSYMQLRRNLMDLSYVLNLMWRRGRRAEDCEITCDSHTHTHIYTQDEGMAASWSKV